MLFVLDYGNDVRQKANLNNFLKFTVDHKAAETTRTSRKHLAREILMNVQCSDGSRSSVKETRALKMRSIEAGPWKVTIIESHYQS